MKRISVLLLTFGLLVLSHTAFAAGDKQIHEEARFIADKIAYQFGLDKDRLTHAYEINYDFLKGVYNLEAALVAGDERAITRYYILLDIRNSDLVWILDHNRFANFLEVESLFRPMYVKDGKLKIRLYDEYKKDKFLQGKPKRFGKYNGEHSCDRQGKTNFYQGRYKQIAYGGQPRLLHDRNKGKLRLARKADFGE